MKMRNRILAALLASVMVLSVVACGGKEEAPAEAPAATEEEAPAEEAAVEKKEVSFPLAEKAEYTVFAVNHADYKPSESISLNHALDEANIAFDFVAEVINTDAAEKANLLIAGGDYPDLFFKVGIPKDVIDGYGEDGIFIPLEDLIREYAPNLTKILDEREGWNNITAADGHVYSLPMIGDPNITGNNPLYINKAWLDKLGLEEPKSLDELYTVMKAFKEQDPNGNGEADEVPMVFSAEIFIANRFSAYIDDVYYDTQMRIENDAIDFFPATEKYKTEYLAFLEKCYEEGLLYQDMYTDTYQNQRAMAKEKTMFGIFSCSTSAVWAPNNEEAAQYKILRPWNDSFPLSNGVDATAAAITDKCENPEVLIAWMDQFYTEEGSYLCRKGIKGEHFDIADDGTLITIVDPNSGNIGFYGTVATPCWVPPYQENVEASATPEASAFNNYMIQERIDLRNMETGTFMPLLTIASDKSADVASYLTDILAYVHNYEAQVVTGQIDLEETWDTYLETLKAMELDAVVEAYNEAYQNTK